MDSKNGFSPFRWMILLVGCSALTSYGIGLTVYPPLFGEIAKDLQVDMSACLNLGMAFVVMVALTVAFGGILVDKGGLIFIVVSSLLCGSVSAALMPWVGHSYGIVFTSRLVQGVLAISFAAIGPILVLWFPRREHGLAGGILQASIGIGAAVGLLATHAVFEVVGTWQKTVALSSIPSWVTILLALLILPRKPSQKVVMNSEGMPKTTSGSETYRKLITEPITWIGMFIFFFNAWGNYILITVVPPYLATAAPMGLGLDPTMVGILSLLVPLISIPAIVLGGVFFDKIGRGNAKSTIFIGFSITGLFAFPLTFPCVYQNVITLGIFLILAGFGLPFMLPALTGFIAKNYPPNLAGSMVGFWFGIGTFGGALGLLLAGVVTARTGSFYWSFVSVSLAAAMGFLLACGCLKDRSSST